MEAGAGPVSLSACRIIGNVGINDSYMSPGFGPTGGALFANNGDSLRLVECRVTGNTATGAAAIDIEGTPIEIVDTEVSSNSFPGGIRISGASPATLVNTTVSGNVGGGIFTNLPAGTAVTAIGVTSSANDTASALGSLAYGGGGWYHMGPEPVALSNTILAGNLNYGFPESDATGSFVSLGHNLIGDPGVSTGFVDRKSVV